LAPKFVKLTVSCWQTERFITADKVAGGRGFRAVWTEVKSGPGGCDQFLCANNSFCIAKHLRCDGIVNCGHNDDSDEAHCNWTIPLWLFWPFISFSVQLGSLALIVLSVSFLLKTKRQKFTQTPSSND
jgi:Low-density lipoprotein receptor domain class A